MFPVVLKILTFAQEKELEQYIIKCAQLHYGLTINNICQLGLEYAKKVGAAYPGNWNELGKATRDWYYAFMKRHKNLSLRTPTPTSANRAKAFNKTTVDAFFRMLGATLDGCQFPPHRIWNADESGFPTVPTKPVKVVGEKGSNVGSRTSAERGTNVTMVMAISAGGANIPPFYLFPRKNMQSTYLYNATPGAVGYANGSGWMTSVDFVNFMHHFIKFAHASKENPLLLLLDNHRSHVTIEVIDLAIEHGITILTLPPHCSHKLQPLDVGVFGPVKKSYFVQCDAWTKNHIGLLLEIQHVAEIAAKALRISLNARNIAVGFERSGIFEFNPEIFSEEDFMASTLSGEHQVSENVVVDMDDERREFVVFDEEPAAHVELTTSESVASTSTSRSVLDELGPLTVVPPKPKSNRGRKPMKSAVITSPENREAAKQAAMQRKSNTPKKPKATPEKRKQPPKKGTPAKRSKKKGRSSSEDSGDDCMLCGEKLPAKLTINNSVACHKCSEFVHAKCANMQNSFYSCPNCDSDDDMD